MLKIIYPNQERNLSLKKHFDYYTSNKYLSFQLQFN